MTAARVLLEIDTTHRPEAVGRDLVGLFKSIGSLPTKVTWAQQVTEQQLCSDADPALAAAARAIARAIDSEPALHDQQPYHSRQHFCEVILTASVLCQLQGLPSRSAQLVLLCALIHDLEHDGKPSKNFRMERKSMERATPYLVAAGVDAEARLRLAALVFATEPHEGVRAATQAQAFHANGTAWIPLLDAPSALSALQEDAELARLAMLVCEADVLPSVGLTLEHSMELQGLLSREWGRVLGSSDKLAFIDSVLAAAVIGPFFLPNVLAIREALAGRVHGRS